MIRSNYGLLDGAFFCLKGEDTKRKWNNKITNRPLVLISVMLAMFVGAVEATIVTTAMPSIASDLGGFSRYSWVFSSYLLMSTVTVLIYGKLADLFGRKPILFIGLTIFLNWVYFMWFCCFDGAVNRF